MKKPHTLALALALALALVTLAALCGISYAQKQKSKSVPVPGHALTVQVISQCPRAIVKNILPSPPGSWINCSSSGGPDCSEPNIPPGTMIRLSSAPLFPLGSWALTGIPAAAVTPGTCGYSSPNVGHQFCEFKMPPNNVNVRVELGCPPHPTTSCQDDIQSGQLTITAPTVSSISPNSANLTGNVSVTPIPPGCTYTANLVWGKSPTPPFPNTLATGTIPSSPLTLTGTAALLLPSSGYGARIEVTKHCPGLAASVCDGPVKSFETPKETQGKATICVVKFEDKNGNGKQDPGEPALPGWIFQIKDAAGNVVATITTGGTGKSCAVVPAPGTYTVTEQVQSGWAPTTPNPQTVTVSPGQTVNLIFGNKRKVSELPDLTIKKRVSCPGPATAQEIKCTITLTITNNGPGTFNGILSVQDSMTPSPSVNWAGGSNPTSSPQGWGWNCSLPLGCATTGPVTLAPPASTTFSVDVYIPVGQYKNCASVKGYTQSPFSSSTLIQEVNSNNNQDCVAFVSSVPRGGLVVVGGVVLPGKCDLATNYVVSPNSVQSGHKVTMTVTVKNVGGADCKVPPDSQGPFVNMFLFYSPYSPVISGLTVSTLPPATPSGPNWSCPTTFNGCVTQNPVPPGYSGTFTFVATVTAPPGPFQSCWAVANLNDSNPANDQSCVTINVY
jgi:SdrD B-like domain/Domain of unknown function DUF11